MSKDANHRGGIWAITAFFNPARYRSRRNNYRVFRERLNLPLLAVELSFNGQFELTTDEAEILIRKSGGDVMWQKERLLNIAVENLPADCHTVVWLDSDIVFQRRDWIDEACRKLDHYKLVQPFSHVHLLPNGIGIEQWTGYQGGHVRPSVARLIEEGMTVEECLGNPTAQYPSMRTPGHAWVARRELLAQYRFYDACIIGGGDTALVCAAYGMWSLLPKLHCENESAFRHYLRWAESFHQSVQGKVSLVEGEMLHLWHGEFNDRRTRQRHHGLASFQYDPAVDIAVGDDGCWRWNSDKWAMHEYVADYFFARNEDSLLSSAATA